VGEQGLTVDAADAARASAAQIARESYGRLVALLASRTRDVAAAEDALAEAFAAALASWPQDGVPANPAGWLLTVARRRIVDEARRQGVRGASVDHLVLMADELEAAAENLDAIPDRRLALMFACAHPAIEHAMRSPLILQTVLGLTAVEIARAFLVPPAAMGQRLVRAKARIKETGIPFRVPDSQELPERRDAVLEAIYAAYGKAFDETGAETPRLADEAIWLARLVVALMPDDQEARGMLALMLYAEARRAARRDADGSFVALEAQDVRLWDGAAIGEAEALLRAASQSGPSGRYQLEAAIQSAHVARRMTGAPTWPAIVALYDHLIAMTGSPVALLNRALALAEVEGAQAALASLDPLTADHRMANYQPYWAALGMLSARAGRNADARESLTLAIGLSDDPAVRRHLQKELDAITDDKAG
jgi:RNA polymerase sigma-70 factor, ECF subfamily